MKVYKLLEPLGQGSYGTVYKARNPRNGNHVAIKQSKLSADLGICYTTIREISLLKELSDHPNIVKFLDVYLEIDKVNLVFELLPMNLHEYIQTYKDDIIPPQVIRNLLSQILEGVNFCHKRRVIHRDLKPSNILITDQCTVKIADFGIARAMGIPYHHHTSGVATLPYRSPELILGESKYSIGVDMWSIGCIIYELCTKKMLFPGQSAIELLDIIYKTLGSPTDMDAAYLSTLPNSHVTYPQYVIPVPSKLDSLSDTNLKMMIKSVLRYIPDERAAAEDLLKLVERAT